MRFAIGLDDFKKLRTLVDSEGRHNFYCDKSLLIKDVIDDGSEIILLPRPRRFGKSLNLSMLKYFFGTEEPLFEGLAISQHQNILEGWRGKFPVIFMGLKNLKAQDLETLTSSLKIKISDVYKEYEYLLTSEKLTVLNKKTIEPYFEPHFTDSYLTNSFLYLTQMLEIHHGQKVWVLIDEYDTPLQEAYLKGFFPESVALFKNILGALLKSNNALYKGVVTGITRIAKESLFSDLNNVGTYDITCNEYAEHFGFTEKEIERMCPKDHISALKSWYNGYRFGDGLTIYNPWSILHFLKKGYKLAPYWINTSSNDLIQECITADKLRDIHALIDGKSLDIKVEPYTVMNNLKENPSSFWNLLFISGYLTLDTDGRMTIPNLEVHDFFEKIVLKWFGGKQGETFLTDLLEDLILGHVLELQSKLQRLILETMSFHDVTERKQESFYHGFLLGMTLGLRDRYVIKSNRESGYGRYDLALYPKDTQKDPGILIEVKMGLKAKAGLQQIEKKTYYQDLQTHGCSEINRYSIAFDGKAVGLESNSDITTV
ncbi:MAG: AAA family ATPase [Myxococcaceae bacterium]|nr:AAA family ATPase [Myxococcaceae bacterium]MBH2006857.1 AAA family ATPase [Myxococcaceae bacterium]